MSTTQGVRPRILVHFTSTAETVGSILRNGLLLVPSPRGLIREFVGDREFEKAEPQEFGMASFTELGISDLPNHRSKYGLFGLALDLSRAVAKGAQRVIYVPADGPLFRAFRWLFRFGYQDLEQLTAKREGMGLSSTNKAMAVVDGAQPWFHLLTLYEYFQPGTDASEVEWRIVNTAPFSHESRDKGEQIRAMLSMPEGWRRGCSVSLEVRDVVSFVCPSESVESLRAALPEEFRNVPIVPGESVDSGTDVLDRVSGAAASVSLPREADAAESDSTAEGDNGPRDYLLPAVSKFEGIAVYYDRVVRDSYLDLSYKDAAGDRNSFSIPLREARYFLGLLNAAAIDPRFPKPDPSRET